MSKLILIRHGLTDWNKEGKWHGLTDISLNQEGQQEAKQAAQTIKNIPIDVAHTSELKRTKETYQIISEQLNFTCPVHASAALNERDYGIYTGENKWQVKEQIGEEEFQKMRRSWDYPIPQGESLKQVSQRVVPYFEQHLLPELKQGHNVLVVSSGNTLRALIKHLDAVPDPEIAALELGFGEIYVYDIDQQGNVTNKQILNHGFVPQATWFHPKFR